MNTRNTGIAQVLRNNPHARPMLSILAREGKVSGMGYTVEHSRPGRGFCCTEYSTKVLPNGRQVSLKTFYPGPFDGLAGFPTDITEEYSVWVGWDKEGEEHDAPPMALPAGATRWGIAAFDGPCNWFAEFDDPELAETFAGSLPPCREDEPVPPFVRIPP
ncbi:MAG: hypothetical protein NT159_08225 [Proteobacteria bacterium]|nr:hypothetical protein [Pseudomonadota bacterium]